MARGLDEYSSLRYSRFERELVIAAFMLAVLLNLAGWGTYYAGNKFGWWDRIHLPGWVPEWLRFTENKYSLQAQLARQTNPEPSIFVDVSQADSDAPSQTKFYSDKNSRAANPDVDNANTPKLNGSQTYMPKTEDVQRIVKRTEESKPVPQQPAREIPKETPKTETPKFTKLEPTISPPSPAPLETAPTLKTPGDLDAKPNESAPPQTTPRPRTLRQAMAERNQLPGRQMQQEGGVPRAAMSSSLDVRETPFGDYDKAIIEAVSQRWYDLLDSRRFADDRDGKVVLRFKLKPDGTVIEMQTLENTVGELLGYLCQEAVEEAAPFAKWPPDMVRMIGSNSRDITFTFYYY